MAKKAAVVIETLKPVKKAAPRVRAAKHRAISHETPLENAPESVALIAYGYWESRGFQGGDPLEDWLRAENEFRQRL